VERLGISAALVASMLNQRSLCVTRKKLHCREIFKIESTVDQTAELYDKQDVMRRWQAKPVRPNLSGFR